MNDTTIYMTHDETHTAMRRERERKVDEFSYTIGVILLQRKQQWHNENANDFTKKTNHQMMRTLMAIQTQHEVTWW